MKSVLTLLYTLLLFAINTLQAQTTRYVKQGGTGDGSSWANASGDLQAMITASSANEQIWVAAGTYKPTVDAGGNSNPTDARTKTFLMKNSVAIYGGFAGTENALSERDWKTNTTILSGDLNGDDVISGSGSTLSITGNEENSYNVILNINLNSTAVLDGFSITSGNANGSGLVYSSGGGMFNLSSSPTIINCVFYGNNAATGGGLYNYNSSSPSIINCCFIKNSASQGGGLYDNYDLTISNCSFFGNNASDAGGGMFDNYGSTIINCTFTGNNAANNGGGMYCDVHPVITNCIIWGNTASTGAGQFNTSGIAPVTYSIVQDIAETYGNKNQDPLFIDAVNGNLRLSPCSPAINAGDNTASSATTDLGGNTRKVGTIDMGAYEYQGSPLTSSVAYVNASASGAKDGSSWTNAFTSLQDALSATKNCSNINQIWVAGGTYYPDEGAGQTNDNRSSTFELKNGVAIYGGFTGTETQLSQRNWKTNVTILSGDLQQNDGANFTGNDDNSYHVIFNNNNGLNSTAVLDGFTITSGNASYDGETAILNYGGGICNDQSSPTLTNCSFLRNKANAFGGAIYNNQSSSIVTNCSFTENTASVDNGGLGGAIYNTSSNLQITNCSFYRNTADRSGAIHNDQSSPTLLNCIFSGNSASAYGGGILNNESSSPILINCSFSKNAAAYGGGIYNGLSSSPTLTNCILWADTGGEIYNDNGTAIVTYSIVQGSGFTGTNGNYDKDPLFVSTTDLHLQGCSPAVDAGNDAVNSTTTDLDGNTRKVRTIDIGAYEYQGTACATCGNATNPTTTGISSTSATFNWTAAVNPRQWQVQYKSTAPGAKWMDVKINNLLPAGNLRAVSVTGLKASQAYNWHIRANCGGTWTAYSGSVSFKTLRSGSITVLSPGATTSVVSEEGRAGLRLYPNPSNGAVNVMLNTGMTGNAIARIELLDINGRTLHVENGVITDGVLQKRLVVPASAAKGLYLVRIVINNDKQYTASLLYAK